MLRSIEIGISQVLIFKIYFVFDAMPFLRLLYTALQVLQSGRFELKLTVTEIMAHVILVSAQGPNPFFLFLGNFYSTWVSVGKYPNTYL